MIQVNLGAMSRDLAEANQYVYHTFESENLLRMEMMRYSTWRISLLREVDLMKIDEIRAKSLSNTRFVALGYSDQSKKFINAATGMTGTELYRADNLSHFVCRMLYSLDKNNLDEFIRSERKLLELKIRRRFSSDQQKLNTMAFLKTLLAALNDVPASSFDLSQEDWAENGSYLSKGQANATPAKFAKLRFQLADSGVRRRNCLLKAGIAFIETDYLLDTLLEAYTKRLKEKLQAMRGPVLQLINQDLQNQLSSFLRQTLKSMAQPLEAEAAAGPIIKLTLKNLPHLSRSAFPPCAHNLMLKLKQHKHLRHDGRRQITMFLKACGLSCEESQVFFRSQYERGKMTAAQVKNQVYNVRHSYGREGQMKEAHAFSCRSIITERQPGTNDHHGCPYKHWNEGLLREYLQKHYKVSTDQLNEIIASQREKMYHVACGLTLESAVKNEGYPKLLDEDLKFLGIWPQQYFKGYMAAYNRHEEKHGGKDFNRSNKKQQLNQTLEVPKKEDSLSW